MKINLLYLTHSNKIANTRKKLLCIVFVLLVLFLFASCTYPVEEKYDNFILDLDLITRFDLCVDKIKRNRASLFTVNELKVLKQDINSWSGDNASIENINNYLIKSADLLLDSIHAGKEGLKEDSQNALEKALEYYGRAKNFIRENSTGYAYTG